MRTALAGTLVSVLMFSPALHTVAEAQGSSGTPFKPEELEQIAAPIALYPDPLLAQVLMASTYPLEVVQAARFLRDNPSLKGASLDTALKQHPWDDSVKSLATFPQVLEMMSEKLDWTQKLGDAFLAQQKEFMEAVQRLRAKAQAQGTLVATKEQKVTVEVVSQAAPSTTIIKIEPTSPQVVYVPVYNPTVVYGVWGYPAYPPYYYYPPGYVAGTAFFAFTAGVVVGAAIWGGCDWRRGDVDIDIDHYNNFTKNVNNVNIANKRTEIQNKRISGGNGTWQHDPEHRKGAQYRDAATQQRFNRSDPPNAQSREAFRGRSEPGRSEAGRVERARATQPTAPSVQPQARSGDASGRRADSTVGGDTQQRSGAAAFDGVGNGAQTQSYSDRGRTSRASHSTGGTGGGRASGGRR